MGQENGLQDLHLHLNGSLSDDFLEMVAERNGVPELYLEFKKKRDDYIQKSNKYLNAQQPKEVISLVWELFSLIHQIMQTNQDIQDAVVDVAKHSQAEYLEIRSTPKGKTEKEREAYIQAFVLGLEEANNLPGKIVKGILSIDRTTTTEEQADKLIARIVQEKKATGSLVGIDISGNPAGNRKIAGETLSHIITSALDQGIGIAIHAGETEKSPEPKDIDTMIRTLQNWRNNQDIPEGENIFHGKVRLGHMIYCSDEQAEQIKEMGIPIEVCPTCHRRMNWLTGSNEHPVKKIYEKNMELSQQ